MAVPPDDVDAGAAGDDRAARPAGARLVRAALCLAVAAVCLAIVGNVVRASHQGWALESDNAAIAINTFDTAHGHVRLVGVHSSAVTYAGIGDFYHPGPIEYWVAALPAGVLGWSASGFLFTAALINVVSVLGVALFARRRGGDGVALAVMVATAVIVWGLGPEIPHDVWNPHIAVFPWLLTLVLLWSVADGDRAALVPLVLAGSFSVQNHFSYLPLLGPLLVGVLVLVALDLRGARRADPDTWPEVRRRWSRAGVAAVVAGVVVWLPVAVQQVTGHPGNVSQLARFVVHGAPQGRRGFGWGIQRLEGFLGARPVWLVREPGFYTMNQINRPIDAVLTIAILAAAGALLVVHWRRGSRVVARLLALVLAAVVLQVIAAASLPQELASSLPYNYRPWWPLCGLLWLALAWGLWSVVAPVAARRIAGGRARRTSADAAMSVSGAPTASVRDAPGPRWLRPAAALAAVAVVVWISVAVVADTSIADDHGHEAFPAIRAIDRDLAARLPGTGPWFVVPQGGLAFVSLENPAILDLARHGKDVRIPREREPYLGTFRRVDPRHLAGIVVVASGPRAAAPRGARVLLRVTKPRTLRVPPALAYPVVVYLLPPSRLADVGGPAGPGLDAANG